MTTHTASLLHALETSAEELLSLAEVAEIIGVNSQAIYRALRAGKIAGPPAARVGSGQNGGKIYLSRTQLIDALHRNSLPRSRRAA